MITPFLMETHMILETKRLILRKLNKDDFFDLAEILKDKETMYAYEHGFSDEEVKNWLDDQLYRYENDGFGLMGVILKEEGKFIGQCGLTMQDYKGESTSNIR